MTMLANLALRRLNPQPIKTRPSLTAYQEQPARSA
jgi:hypothetical protein